MNLKKILIFSGIALVIVIGIIYGFKTDKLVQENYLTYKDGSGRFSFKYNKKYTISKEGGFSKITSKEIEDGFEKSEKSGEIPVPLITFEIVSHLPKKIIPEAKEFKKIPVNNLDVYTGELVPSAQENRVYFVKLKDGSFLQFMISPFLSDTTSEFLKDSYSKLDGTINEILFSIEIY